MNRRVEYNGYQIEVGISDVTGPGIVASIKPLTDAAAAVDARAQVMEKDNMIFLELDWTRSSGERDKAALVDLGLRAATIEVDARLARANKTG